MRLQGGSEEGKEIGSRVRRGYEVGRKGEKKRREGKRRRKER